MSAFSGMVQIDQNNTRENSAISKDQATSPTKASGEDLLSSPDLNQLASATFSNTVTERGELFRPSLNQSILRSNTDPQTQAKQEHVAIAVNPRHVNQHQEQTGDRAVTPLASNSLSFDQEFSEPVNQRESSPPTETTYSKLATELKNLTDSFVELINNRDPDLQVNKSAVDTIVTGAVLELAVGNGLEDKATAKIIKHLTNRKALLAIDPLRLSKNGQDLNRCVKILKAFDQLCDQIEASTPNRADRRGMAQPEGLSSESPSLTAERLQSDPRLQQSLDVIKENFSHFSSEKQKAFLGIVAKRVDDYHDLFD